MLSRVRNSRGRPRNAPAAFIHPCQSIVASGPPTGPGWAHELKHDGYRLQIHVRDGRVRLYTMNGADWSKRYPLVAAEAARLKVSAILDAEVVCADKDGVPDFGLLHSRCLDQVAVACAFDLLMLDGDDMRRKPFAERKAALGRLLFRTVMASNTSNMPRDTATDVCRRLRSRSRGHCFKETGCALSIGAIQKLAEGQEPQSTCRHTGY